MSASPQVLIAIVVALSVLHMVAPDHWVPVTVASHRMGYSRTKSLALASGIGLAHGASSAVLSVAIAVIGSLVFPAYYVNLFAVVLLLAIALYVMLNAVRESGASTEAGNMSLLVSVIPDPALVPFIVVARGFGPAYTYAMLGAYVAAAVVSVSLVVLLAVLGLSAALSKVRPQYVDYLVAATLILVAAFVYVAG